MRLLIISDMGHFRRSDGTLVGHGATSREIDALATMFDEIRHIACFSRSPAPASARPYAASNVTTILVPPAGGSTLDAKLDVLRHGPMYTRTILREASRADVLFVRCPSNISMYAILLLPLLRRPRLRWIKYAGTWRPDGREAPSYKLQRLWLRSPLHGAKVTINGSSIGEPPHVVSFVNPCLTDDELAARRRAAVAKRLSGPVRLLFAGELNPNKNPRVAIDALIALRGRAVTARLDVAGDGELLEDLRAYVRERDLESYVVLHGALPRSRLDELYDASHFIVLPSLAEGWPKVLSEGMAAGSIPIATDVGSIGGILEQLDVGRALAVPPHPNAFANAIAEYVHDPGRWQAESERALRAAPKFSYSAFLDAVRALLEL